MKYQIIISLLLSLFVFGQSNAAVDIDAQIVQLRTSCTESNAAIDNCFTSLDDLNTWIQNTRKPNAASPLSVNIGPGTFPGVFQCNTDQHISLNGSGRTSTILTRTGSGLGYLLVFELKDDCHLSVQDLKIDNVGGLAAVQVNDSSTSRFNILSTWNNVEITTTGYVWVEEHCDPSITGSKHFWNGSKLTSIVTQDTLSGFAKTYASCAENWFHGTEITARADIPVGVPQVVPLLAIGETHVYGGVIRAITGPGVSLPDPGPYSGGVGPQGVVAIYGLGSQANIHVHGAGIDVLSDKNNNVAGIVTEGAAHVHVMDASFNMASGCDAGNCGELRRIVNADGAGMIRSTFQWPSSTEAPLLASQNGADTFVETDCDASGNCDSALAQDQRPHMMVYATNCTIAGPWFDTVTSKCRGE